MIKVLYLHRNNYNKMAKPIRNTPILTGKDATDFIKAASSVPSEASRKIERDRLDKSVSRFKALLANLPK